MIDSKTFTEKTRITMSNSPGCRSSRPTANTPTFARPSISGTDVDSVADHEIIANVKQESPFCPKIAATPDGSQTWFTLRIGRTQAFRAKPPFNLIKTIDTLNTFIRVDVASTSRWRHARVLVDRLDRSESSQDLVGLRP